MSNSNKGSNKKSSVVPNIPPPSKDIKVIEYNNDGTIDRKQKEYIVAVVNTIDLQYNNRLNWQFVKENPVSFQNDSPQGQSWQDDPRYRLDKDEVEEYKKIDILVPKHVTQVRLRDMNGEELEYTQHMDDDGPFYKISERKLHRAIIKITRMNDVDDFQNSINQFNSNIYLKEVIIPKNCRSLKYIEDEEYFEDDNGELTETSYNMYTGAFQDCVNLENVYIEPNSELNTIDEDIFKGCIKLKSFDFRNCMKLETIGKEIFSECYKLKEIRCNSKVLKLLMGNRDLPSIYNHRDGEIYWDITERRNNYIYLFGEYKKNDYEGTKAIIQGTCSTLNGDRFDVEIKIPITETIPTNFSIASQILYQHPKISKHPGKVIVVCGDTQLTRLKDTSDEQWAHNLRRLQLGNLDLNQLVILFKGEDEIPDYAHNSSRNSPPKSSRSKLNNNPRKKTTKKISRAKSLPKSLKSNKSGSKNKKSSSTKRTKRKTLSR